ncbi:MAG: 4-alpha-glucanotransferase [Hyphomicrobiaceae bacterium]
MSEALDRLAEAYGISLGYLTEAGTYQRVSERAKRGILAALGVVTEAQPTATPGIAAPPPESGEMMPPAHAHCFVPHWLRGGRAWGVTCQLYGVRSERNWGIGDFEDLARLAEYAGACGADFIGVNPLHALFLADPARRSPYSPSSRRFLNPLYIAVDMLDGARRASSQAVATAREADLVDYAFVGKLKQAALAACFARFERDDLARRTERAHRFRAFCREFGEALELFARYEALSAELVPRGLGCGWHGWPAELRSPIGEAAFGFVRANATHVLFHKWLQWIADDQLADAQRRALAAGMRIGLYLDLAVGVAPDGADTWAAPETVVSGAHIGSPPDAFNRVGQDWGLSPLSPIVLREGDGAPVAATLQGLMRHAGAIRIDHVMGLVRLYWVPAGFAATDGAYVSYPGEVLMRQLASASLRHSALVIGEDLGTVPPGFRDSMRAMEIQGYRVLYFERGKDGGFRAPSSYARAALACISTHDLPTLRGWWKGSDIAERERLGRFGPGAAKVQRHERERARRLLLRALKRERLAPDKAGAGRTGAAPAELPDSVLTGLHVFLARTHSRLVAVQLEDLVGMEEQANLPGTIDEHPNWRRKLPVTLEDLPRCRTFQSVVIALATERPRLP